MKKPLLLLTLFLVLLSACEEADDWVSRRYPGRRFFFFEQEHSTSLLFSAYRSPGMYVYAYTKMVGLDDHRVRHVYVQSNAGTSQSEDNIISTARELKCPYVMGASNDIGLIIGCTNFNGPVAYDRICPNCADMEALSWATNRQHVACPKCKREYDLETAAIVAGEKGDALLRYGISYNGTCLYVGN